jgi:hypothetical protein
LTILFDGVMNGTFTGLFCGFIAVCVRRWAGGTLVATACGSALGYLGSALAVAFSLTWLFGSDEMSRGVAVGVGVGSVLAGGILGAYLGARWSRSRAMA